MDILQGLALASLGHKSREPKFSKTAVFRCHHPVDTPLARPVFDVIATCVPADWQIYKMIDVDTRHTPR